MFEDRESLMSSPKEQREEDEFQALYGRGAPLTPAEVADVLAGFDRPWWVVGGWAIEAATGYLREHEDTDISLLACDLPALVAHLAGDWHVWNNVGGVLHPLGGQWQSVDDPGSQLWVRKDACSAWVLDIPLTPDREGRWSNKRNPEHAADLDDVTFIAADGIRYLNPEIVMSYKAALNRPKDTSDLTATLTVLPPSRRAWLRAAVAHQDPQHPCARKRLTRPPPAGFGVDRGPQPGMVGRRPRDCPTGGYLFH
ncbi:hypothetical protein GCM10009721_39730 [Terrabacter tumescens]|uniref:Aminoglycoside-2''-adenylyltransferase n=1 Tax=Terrabacter tumescens TaxID=60443 RepID=A0ABQ2IDR2_9MICO|nr:hypothetical protein [Terrabacter tumescens]GGN08055.1 hypothetical protein GCM10009721_39730 [Terrabacter tumescens]